jgi:hypothetical protein
MVSKKPRIVRAKFGTAVEVTNKVLTDANFDVEREVKLLAYRQARRPHFRYRGRWPYRAFGRPTVLLRTANDWDLLSPNTTMFVFKWERAVALWR